MVYEKDLTPFTSQEEPEKEGTEKSAFISEDDSEEETPKEDETKEEETKEEGVDEE